MTSEEGIMVVQWWSLLPFAAMLLAIAVLPLVPPVADWWGRHSSQLIVALALGLPVAIWFSLAGAGAVVADTVWEYLQFIILLGSLYVISGGIFLTGDLRATPRTNTAFLAIGGVLASVIGTTGAAMLLIRPILNTNAQRTRTVHTVIFLIFIVANCGGLLTPLGDPPLFLGFLRGVPFTWTLSLLPEWAFVVGLLLLSYYGLERREYARETPEALSADSSGERPLGLVGGGNLAFLAVVVLAVAFLPSLDLAAIEEGHATLATSIPWRELTMIAAGAASYLFGNRVARFTYNHFAWGPIAEVAVLFIGIFLTMMPALEFLAQVAPSLPLGSVPFFAFSGSLSAVLDNAPTYATFFEMAAQLPGDPRVAGVPEAYLAAISLGSVFCGAITYIGNGPNFMVKAVADRRGVPMPSFGGYLRWSAVCLVPVLVAMAAIFVAEAPWARILGVILAAAIAAVALVRARTPRAALSE